MEHKNIDVNKPVENPKLVELLDQRNHISPQNEDWDSLMNNILQYIAEEGMFLAVTQFDKSNVLNHGDGTSTIQKDTVIQFESLSTNDGETYFPIYTDWKNLRENPNHSTGEIETMIFINLKRPLEKSKKRAKNGATKKSNENQNEIKKENKKQINFRNRD